MGGWLDTDNKTISVQLNLTGTATGTELGNRAKIQHNWGFGLAELGNIDHFKQKFTVMYLSLCKREGQNINQISLNYEKSLCYYKKKVKKIIRGICISK